MSSKQTSTIQAIKRKYTPKLLSMQGVEGVGAQEERGKEVLVVYVSQKTKALEQKVSSLVKNCPVRLQATGEFRAL